MTPEEKKKLEELLRFEMDANRPFLVQFEEAAERDKTGLIQKWLEEEVYTDLELMKEWDPLAVARVKQKSQMT
jgi:hypothetical protein